MLSNASKYAVKAMLFLVLHTGKSKKIGVKHLAKTLDVPEPFLAKILQQLVRNGLLSSVKGPNGGFYTSKSNTKNKICDILQTVDGHPLFDKCFMGLEKCSESNPCPLHNIVVAFKDNLFEKFNKLTLAEFASDIDASSTFLDLNS
jgi:Rrf2 family transcriptional regulator, iron-sulfur cluster assembly transcription factor